MSVKLANKGTDTPNLTDRLAGIEDPSGTPLVRLYTAQATRDLFALAGINTQTGTTYTLALTDQGDIVEMNNGSANTLTIPTNAAVAFPVGTVISVTQLGAGTTTVAGDTGVTVNGVSAGSAAISAQYSGVTIYKRATDTWVMQGDHGGVT